VEFTLELTDELGLADMVAAGFGLVSDDRLLIYDQFRAANELGPDGSQLPYNASLLAILPGTSECRPVSRGNGEEYRGNIPSAGRYFFCWLY
jgi:hypothetical protein